jgi:cation transport ATPase
MATHRADEDEEHRLDRELTELLNEIRVAMPGVQLLFAFLLAVPFQQRFAQATTFQKDVYFVTLLSAAAAAAFFVAPVAYHRLTFRHRNRPTLVQTGSLSALIGLVALAISMTCAILLVTDVIFGTSTVVATAIAVGLLFAVLWFGIGAYRRITGRRDW